MPRAIACAVLLQCAYAAFAAELYTAKPARAEQGAVVKLGAPAEALEARLGDRTIPLFSESGGGRSGLMPVAARTKPGAYTIEFLGDGGRGLASRPITVRDAKFPKQNIVLDKRLAELKAAPGEMESVTEFRQTVTPERLWSEPFAAPLPGCRTSPFGVQRLHNGKPTGNYHQGVDQKASQDEPIHAIADGTVKLARMFDLHGGTVALDHGQGLLSIYLHQSKFAVTEGAAVHKGEVIGYAGSTGRSTAPHLHWSIYVHNVAVNPQRWVKMRPCSASRRKRKPQR